MEEYDEIQGDESSGIYTDISAYLEDRFNYPNSGQDPVKVTKPTSGFESWINDKF